MTGLMLVLALAIVVEGLIEISKSIGKAFISGQWKTAVTQLIAMGIGVVLCLGTNADMFKAMNITFAYPVIGVVLTGLFASRGSNYVSDFVSKLQGANATATAINNEVDEAEKVKKIADATQEVTNTVVESVSNAVTPTETK